MPRYRVTELSFINNALAQPGDEVSYDGEPGKNLEPIDKAGAAAAKTASSVPVAVADLLIKVRQHAATRGVSPDQVNQNDFDEVLAVLPVKPSADVIAAAIALAAQAVSVA